MLIFFAGFFVGTLSLIVDMPTTYPQDTSFEVC